MKFDNYEITELGNGLRVISEYIPHFRSISLGFWVSAGSRNEARENNGITHLIEHLLFKGTKKRSYRDIAIEFDSVGAEYNAFTDKENSCFYADFIDTNLDRCMELLFDIVFNPSFLNSNIEVEKRIIFEEIKMVEDSPSEDIFNFFYRDLFGTHPLSLPVLGSIESLKNCSEKTIWQYFENNFNFQNMVISAAGNIKHKCLIEGIKKNLGQLSLKQKGKKNHIKKSIPVNRKFKNVYKNKTKAVHICYGGLGCSRNDSERYPLAVFTSLFGGSMSSRLFQRIREEEGLSYSIFSTNSQYSDTGVVLTYAAVSPSNTLRIIDLINDELEEISREKISSSEIIRAKENIKGSIVLNVEDISSRMFRLGKSMIMDKKVLTIDEILKKIDDVRVDKINKVRDRYFNPEDMSIVILGDIDKREAL
ncbi:MAG: M16 family metallopeptidase [Actinomycetota bacterium]